MHSLDLPDSFKQNVIGAFPDGKSWLESLPELLAECEERWEIVVDPPFDLSFNYVAPATTRDGRAVVVKLGVPNPELPSEIQALRLYAGQGAVPLLEADEEKGILLMERITPGQPLSSVAHDEQATFIAAQTLRRLWRPLPRNHSFPTIEKWADGLKRLRKRFDGGTGPFPARLVNMAAHLFADLFSSAPPAVLLHGDLHHFNILLGQDEWIAIDPKGVAGEPAYEVGPLLANPSWELYTDVNVQRRRLDVLADQLYLDRERMLAYGVAHAVLSAWWSYEDSRTGWESRCTCAETLASLMG